MEAKKTQNYGVGLGATLLILTLIRFGLVCNKEHTKYTNASALEQVGEKAREDIMNAEIVIDSLVKAQGHIFLYTDDTLAKAGWVPNIPSSDMPSNDLFGGLTSEISESKNYRLFTEKYDSLGFTLAVYNDYELIPLNENIVLRDGVAKKLLYFMGHDSKDEMPYDSKIEISKDSDMLKTCPHLWEGTFVTSWNVGFSDVSKFTVDSLSNVFFFASTRFMKKINGFQFYMAGVEKDIHHPGIDSISFMRSVEVLNKSLKKSGIDTKRFHVKVF